MKKFNLIVSILTFIGSFPLFSQSTELRPRTEEYCQVSVQVINYEYRLEIINSSKTDANTYVSPLIEMDTLSFRLTQKDSSNFKTISQLLNYMNSNGWEVLDISFENVLVGIFKYRNYVIFFRRKYIKK